MANYLENKRKHEKKLEKYYQEKSNMRLKYAALASISISIILMLIMIFCLDCLTKSQYLIIRGCTGLFAVIFAILLTILIYRVNTSYHKEKYNPRSNGNP